MNNTLGLRSTEHRHFMKRALELAEQGLGHVSPNPMVGALLVRDGEILAEGYHKAYGGPHAEVEALSNFEKEHGEISDRDIMYISLEPCNHYGKMPPCTEALLKAGVRNVVIAMLDPNPLVAGCGVEKLKNAGVSVLTGVLEDQARHLNRAFIKHMTTGRPYACAKWAMTIDGKMATDSGNSAYISSEMSRRQVHKWRRECDAVVIGKGTAKLDNPRLDVRMVEGRNPYRVVIDTLAEIQLDSHLVQCEDAHKTIVLTTPLSKESKRQDLLSAGVEVVLVDQIDGRVDLVKAFEYLASRGLVNLLIEAGPTLQGALLQSGLIDSVKVFIAPKLSGGSRYSPFGSLSIDRMADAVKLINLSSEIVDGDILLCADIGRCICSQDS